jgi:hypothetical protein
MTPTEEIAALKARIAELEASLPWPKVGDKYYYVSGDGVVDYDTYMPTDEVDIGRMSQGNIKRTLEEAERERDRRAVMTELRGMANGFVPDWGHKNNKVKWFLEMDDYSVIHAIGSYQIRRMNQVYFRTKEDAQDAIEALGDRLNVLFEGV